MDAKRGRLLGAVVLLIVGVVLALYSLATAQQAGAPAFVPGEVLVKLKTGVGAQVLATLKAQHGLESIRIFPRVGLHHFRILSRLSVPQVIARLRQSPFVEYAEPNYIRQLFQTPNDPGYPELWGLNNTGQTGGTPGSDIDAPQAWEIQTGSPSVVVADIDSGIDLTHEDLVANLWTNPGEIPGNGIDDDGNGFIDDVHGWDFRDNDSDPTDTSRLCSGHGTHTAGTIGAVGDNGIGVAGVSWIVKIMPLRVFGGFLCSGRDSDTIAAIEYYTSFGVRISNNSYGGGAFSQAVSEAIRTSHSLFVAAAGNSGTDNDAAPQYPASYELDSIVSVAATDHNDQPASFSNYGLTTVDVGAPGVNILSTLPGSAYGYLSGTSMATPHVAGLASLLLAKYPSTTSYEMKWRILRGADPTGLPVFSRGRINAQKALALQAVVTVQVTPLGASTVASGDVVPYQVSVTNTASSAQTIDRLIYLRHPDGSERTIQGPTTVSLAPGETATQSFSLAVPVGVPPSLFGVNRLVGRAWSAGFTSFDEDEALYTVVP